MELKSKKALEQFLDIVRKADATFLNPEKNLDHQGHVDGYSHLFHLLRTTIDFYLFNDPLKPQFMLLANPSHKILGDNVDAVYYFTQLRSDQEYIIRGKRFDSCYLSFSTYGGGEPEGGIVERVCQNINHRDIQFGKDGSFEIKLTPHPNGVNEFKLDEDVVNLFTREYFFDRKNGTESTLEIINTQQGIVPPLTDDELSRRIGIMSTFFEQSTWMAPLPIEFPENDFLPPFEFYEDQGGWGTVDNIYCFGKFKLENNQYLKIHFTSPECCYWGIQTWNYLMQSMDYTQFPVSINKGQAKANQDGSFTIYLSHQKMDVDNWISTAQYKEAIIFIRWLLAEKMPDQPIVELHELS